MTTTSAPPPPTTTSKGASGSSPGTNVGTIKSTSDQHQHHHHHHNYEERLERVWRSLASCLVVATQRAENLAEERKQKPADQCKQSLKDLDEAVITFLRTRLEYRRQLAMMEAKLEGRTKEMEALLLCQRSQPRVGKRKREEAIDDNPQVEHNAPLSPKMTENARNEIL